MSTPQHVAVAAIDMSSGETAAAGVSDAIFNTFRAVERRLVAEHGDEIAMVFYTVLVARMGGFLAGQLGPSDAITLIAMTLAALQDCQPDMARELTARQGKAH